MPENADPFEQIGVVEHDLRVLVEEVLSSSLGGDWLGECGLTHERLEEIDRRRTEEARRRPGAIVDRSALRYAQFFELRTIIHKHWEFFKPILGERKRFDVYFGRLEDFRNAPAHSRALLPFERALVEGIAGEIRNLITLHRSSMDPSGDYYPIIESVRDSFGNEWARDTYLPMLRTGIRLEVGQVVEFDCKAWDPQSRELTWTATWGIASGHRFFEAKGESVRLRAKIEETMVGESLYVEISLKSSGRYHRGRLDDDSVSFRYAVNPPGVRNGGREGTPRRPGAQG